MSYAAPSGYNTNGNGGGDHHRQTSGYSPTTVPTPGQPLLQKGNLLVYPHGWQGCPKCQDTGFKHGDPTHPCRGCWTSYGQRYNPLLVSSAGLQGSKVLQRPLPFMNGPYGQGGGMQGGNAGYPGTTSQQHFHQQPHNTASIYQNPQMTGSSYQPPPQPPPISRRRSPPQVVRAEDAREDNEDEDGEAPPAYADAVAAGPDDALPPQRRDEQGRIIPTHTGSSGNTSNSIASQYTGATFASPSHQPNNIPGSFPPPPQHPNTLPYPPQMAPYHPMPSGFRPPPPQIIPYGHIPPQGALILRPGDPRIGGRLCYKCGGQGVRESLFWGDETCFHCGGSGRMM